MVDSSFAVLLTLGAWSPSTQFSKTNRWISKDNLYNPSSELLLASCFQNNWETYGDFFSFFLLALFGCCTSPKLSLITLSGDSLEKRVFSNRMIWERNTIAWVSGATEAVKSVVSHPNPYYLIHPSTIHSFYSFTPLHPSLRPFICPRTSCFSFLSMFMLPAFLPYFPPSKLCSLHCAWC